MTMLRRPPVGGGRRRAVAVDTAESVRLGYLAAGDTLPRLVEAAVRGLDAVSWARRHRESIRRELLTHGAVLLRGFEINGVAEFEQVICALSDEALAYTFRASPRRQIEAGVNVYTSTDYPPDQAIFPHNEHAYSPVFPGEIFFFCDRPAESGGATPIGDARRFLRVLPESVLERFASLGVLYVRNYNTGFGLPWQTVFQTEDRSRVEAHCRRQGIDVEWLGRDRLRTRHVGPALVRHPDSGERAWFNHATFFHVTTLAAELREGVTGALEEGDYPTQTYYGDGTAIEPEVLEMLRAMYTGALVEFAWQRGDVLVLDNLLAVHGRTPYRGDRRVVVGMARPLSWAALAVEPGAGAKR